MRLLSWALPLAPWYFLVPWVSHFLSGQTAHFHSCHVWGREQAEREKSFGGWLLLLAVAGTELPSLPPHNCHGAWGKSGKGKGALAALSKLWEFPFPFLKPGFCWCSLFCTRVLTSGVWICWVQEGLCWKERSDGALVSASFPSLPLLFTFSVCN